MDTVQSLLQGRSDIRIVALEDPLVDQSGFDPTSRYVEFCWLPIIGPTGTLAYRRLGTLVSERSDGVVVDLVELARALGVRDNLTRYGPLTKALDRLLRFGFARLVGGELTLRRRVATAPTGFGG